LPTKRTSAGLQGKPGKNGATCSIICPPSTARDRFTASLRMLRIFSSFWRRSKRRPALFPIKNTETNKSTVRTLIKKICADTGNDINAA